MRRRSLFLVIATVLMTGGCQKDSNHESSAGNGPTEIKIHKIYQGPYPIKVVCTTGMVADLVRHVGEKHVRVKQLMGAGVDPHLYKASPGDVRQLHDADLVFYSGRHLEGKMTEIFASLARKKPTFAVTAKMHDDRMMQDEDGEHDPHLWFDVALWSQGIDLILDVLVQFDPSHQAEYEANGAAYRKTLAELHDYAKTQMARIPKDRRVLVTAHDAFRYFGRAYDVEVRGIQGISTESEAGVREINALVELLCSRRIKAVFVETSVSEKNVRALIEGCQARGHHVVVGGELYSDAMGEEGTPAGTYPGMIQHNVDTIVKALQ